MDKKEAMKIYLRRYRVDNRDTIKAQKRRYYEEQKDVLLPR